MHIDRPAIGVYPRSSAVPAFFYIPWRTLASWRLKLSSTHKTPTIPAEYSAPTPSPPRQRPPRRSRLSALSLPKLPPDTPCVHPREKIPQRAPPRPKPGPINPRNVTLSAIPALFRADVKRASPQRSKKLAPSPKLPIVTSDSPATLKHLYRRKVPTPLKNFRHPGRQNCCKPAIPW